MQLSLSHWTSKPVSSNSHFSFEQLCKRQGDDSGCLRNIGVQLGKLLASEASFVASETSFFQPQTLIFQLQKQFFCIRRIFFCIRIFFFQHQKLVLFSIRSQFFQPQKLFFLASEASFCTALCLGLVQSQSVTEGEQLGTHDCLWQI